MRQATDSRNWRGRAALAGLVAAGLTASLVAAAPAEAATFTVVPVANPDLVLSCGLDIVLALDSSNSLGPNGSNRTADVKSAANAFLTAFQDTNTRVGIVKFNQRATIDVPLTFDSRQTNAPTGPLGVSIASYTNAGQTNWQAAFTAVNSTFASAPARNVPKLTIFVSDGEPNTYTNPDGTVSAQQPDGDPSAIDPAVTQANLFKSAGGHVLGVMLNDTFLTKGAQNFSRISQYYLDNPQYTWTGDAGSTPFDAATTDYLVNPDVTTLTASLRNVAGQSCQHSLSVTQSATSASAPLVHGNGGTGWTTTTAVTPSGGWTLPVLGDPSVSSASVASDAGGTSVFQWGGSDLKSATVSVAPRALYRFTGVTCTRDDALIDGVTGTVDPGTGAFGFTVPDGIGGADAVACTVLSSWTGKLTSWVSLIPAAKFVVYGRTATKLAGIARSPLARLAGVKVGLQTRLPGTTRWSTLKTLTTTSTGYFALTVAPTTNRQYRAVYAGSVKLFPAASSTSTVWVRPRVASHLTLTTKRGVISGTVVAGSRGRYVYLQRLYGTTWKSISRGTLTSGGSFAFGITRTATRHIFRVMVPPTRLYYVGLSSRYSI